MRIPKPWECVRCGEPIRGRGPTTPVVSDLGAAGTDPFCGAACRSANMRDYLAASAVTSAP